MHLTRARLILILILVPVLVLPGCRSSATTPDGAWRDQFILVTDDGSVLSLGVHRQANGQAEAKVWLGRGDSWQSVFYKSFSIARTRAPKLSATLDRLSGAPARINVTRNERTLAIDLRTPKRSVEITVSEMHKLGETTDPEGTTVYRAGRAWVRDNSSQHDGWLIAAETPAAKPHRPFIDYGRFVFLVVASRANGVLVAKRSLDQPKFNHAFTIKTRRAEHTRDVVIDVGPDALTVELKQLGRRARYRIADRNTSHGVGPAGNKLVYETLLLRGADTGVAFLIRPEKKSDQ